MRYLTVPYRDTKYNDGCQRLGGRENGEFIGYRVSVLQNKKFWRLGAQQCEYTTELYTLKKVSKMINFILYAFYHNQK